MKTALTALFSRLDLTEIFKTKGNLKRWSAKRSIGGVVALTGCSVILEGDLNLYSVALCAIGILPISLSFFERN